MDGKTRHPWGVWGLAIITFGIYGLYWWYKANEEVAAADPTIEVNPTMAMLALFVPICNIVTIFKTGERIAQAQGSRIGKSDTSGGLGILLAFLGGFNFVYYQSGLNEIWAGSAAGAPPAAAPPPPPA